MSCLTLGSRAAWAGGVALGVLAALAACADRPGGAPVPLALAIERPRALENAQLTLNVYAGATCGATGEVAGGEVLPGLGELPLVRNTPLELRVPSGDRTFEVLAHEGGTLVGRGCDRRMLSAGGTAQVTITLHELGAGDPDAGPNDPDAGPDDPDAAPTADAGPDAAPPPNDTCDLPGPLVVATPATGDTRGGADDFTPSCLIDDGPDTFHRIDTTGLGARSLLVTLVPDAPGWDAALALFPAGGCPDGMGALSCVAGAFATRYINRPNLPAGSYVLAVDGANGAAGGYAVRYDLAAADNTFGYRRIDSMEPYVELTGGTTVPGFAVGGANSTADEATWTVSLPFDFPFFGATYTAVAAHANGFLTFGAVPNYPDSYLNDCPLDTSTPNATIALFWDDATPAYPTSVVRSEVQGTAPFRRVVIEYKDFDFVWFGMGNYQNQNMKVTQQVVLHEDGDVELRYGPRDNSMGFDRECGLDRIFGCDATIGIENAGGTDVDGAQCDTATPKVQEGRVIRFVHPR